MSVVSSDNPKGKSQKRIGIHQPNFFPWLGYFHKMKQCDVFVILDTVDIVLGSSKSITHRTKIKTAQGEHWLTIPLVKSESKEIQTIEINDGISWKSKMLQTVYQNYRKAAFFEETYTFFETCLSNENHLLSKFNTAILLKLMQKMDIDCEVLFASELPIYSQDRNNRLIEIIQHLNGTTYVSGKGGTQYHDVDLFQQAQIQIEPTAFLPFAYPQLYGEFIPGLSCIDFLFNCEPLKIFMHGKE